MKRAHIIIIIAIFVVIFVAGGLGLYFKQFTPKVTKYSYSKPLNLSYYSAGSQIIALFTDCIAISIGSPLAYVDGKYIDTKSNDLMVYENALFYINSSFLNEYTSTNYQNEKLSLHDIKEHYLVYENKMLVIILEEKNISVFDDLYILEALYLRLQNKLDEDIENAFLNLPNLISNNDNYASYYSDPNLHLGIQTSLYSDQMGQVDSRPEFIVGEGRESSNRTLVRIFNEYQTLINQFLAYKENVKGGVQVKALLSNNRNYIVTSPYVSWPLEAQEIKVFDLSGLIQMKIKSKLKAPYTISTGNFLGYENEELILVTEMNPKDKIVLEFYSLDKGKLYKKIEINSTTFPKNDKLNLQVIDSNSLLFFFEEAREAYIANLSNKSLKKLYIDLKEGVNGIYPTENPDEYVVTYDEETFSSIVIVKDKEEEKQNVGWKENRFYSTYADPNPDSYIDYSTFLHKRVDLSSGVMRKLSKLATAESILNTSDYSEWARPMSDDEKNNYHAKYNMWEPCFTHRWNRNTQTSNLVSIIDEKTNMPKYASIGKDNKGSEYLELSSSFLIGSYADGLLPMDKMRLYPIRSFLQDLSVEYYKEPDKLVSVSPVHEQEINVAGSIGDYNPNMIIGFRTHLLKLYGSLDKINKRFNTNFKTIDDIDAPRDTDRGTWDKYGESDFFSEWSLYNRLIINKRILEAYREALLAGFPPENINAHQIPEGDAVSGFLGEANTRLSPIDVVMSCGTAFGGTRYGFWMEQENNWLINARKAGHKNITIGEYSSLSRQDQQAFMQLNYLFNNGVKMTHVLVPYASDSPEYDQVRSSELYAIKRLQMINSPRPGYTGGTTDFMAYTQSDGKQYNIIRLGTGKDQNGLLKSINSDGSFEGSVYLVPFHSKVRVEELKISKGFSNIYKSKTVKNLHHGDQIELTFEASSKNANSLTIYATYDGAIIDNSVISFQLDKDNKQYRYVFANQLSLVDGVEIHVEFEKTGYNASNFYATVQRESVARKYFGEFNSLEHKGGINYDVLRTINLDK